MPPLQSAYRSGHLTETALIKVISDIINAADDQQVTLLGLLDMSAAFDTVDHDILLHRLETYGVRRRALWWLTSFLTGRTQAMSYAGLDVPTMPTIVWCAAGFGPRTSSFRSLYGRCHRDCHGTWNSNPCICRRHPDLRQLRRLGSSTRCHTSVGLHIENRILDELKSAETECLKTEFIWIGTRRQLSKVEEETLIVGGQSVTPMVKVRDLGVFIDRVLTMEAHVSNTVRGCMYQLRQLRSVKRSLTLDSRRALSTAFVASRIDYCNGVLWYGKVQPRHPYPLWCPPLAPCTAPNQLQNHHTGSGLYSRDWTGLFWWSLRSCDCNPWTNQPAFSDAWRFLCSLEHEQNWADGVFIYPHRQCGTCSLIRSSILVYAANIFEKNWKHTCSGKPTHQPWELLKSELTCLLTYHSHPD